MSEKTLTGYEEIAAVLHSHAIRKFGTKNAVELAQLLGDPNRGGYILRS